MIKTRETTMLAFRLKKNTSMKIRSCYAYDGCSSMSLTV